jgi:hypothetical protein
VRLNLRSARSTRALTRTVGAAVAERSAGLTVCSGREQLAASCRDALPVREELTGVLEENDAVTEQAPALLRVRRYDMRSVAIERARRRARRIMRTRAQRTGWLSVGEHISSCNLLQLPST